MLAVLELRFESSSQWYLTQAIPVSAAEAYVGSRGIAPPILNIGAR